jgi:hypothetical protein
MVELGTMVAGGIIAAGDIITADIALDIAPVIGVAVESIGAGRNNAI